MPRSKSRSDAASALVVGAIYRDVIRTEGQEEVRAIGGAGNNIARHLVHAGLDVELFTMLEPGADGDELSERLTKRGLRVESARARGSVGEYRVSMQAGEAVPMSVRHPDCDVSGQLIELLRGRSADFLIVELGAPRALVDGALALAKVAPSFVIALPTRADTIENWRGVLGSVDLLVLNQREAAVILGSDTLDTCGGAAACSALVALGTRAVLLTFGAGGAVTYDRARRSSWHAAPLGPVVSALGAGDALTAGVIAGLAAGLELRDAVDAALPRVELTLGTLAAVPDYKHHHQPR